jgi:hypothetical protein
MLGTAPVHERHIMDMTRIKWSRLFCGHNYTQIAKKRSVMGHHLLLARVETKKKLADRPSGHVNCLGESICFQMPVGPLSILLESDSLLLCCVNIKYIHGLLFSQ